MLPTARSSFPAGRHEVAGKDITHRISKRDFNGQALLDINNLLHFVLFINLNLDVAGIEVDTDNVEAIATTKNVVFIVVVHADPFRRVFIGQQHPALALLHA